MTCRSLPSLRSSGGRTAVCESVQQATIVCQCGTTKGLKSEKIPPSAVRGFRLEGGNNFIGGKIWTKEHLVSLAIVRTGIFKWGDPSKTVTFYRVTGRRWANPHRGSDFQPCPRLVEPVPALSLVSTTNWMMTM